MFSDDDDPEIQLEPVEVASIMPIRCPLCRVSVLVHDRSK
jgi:hypothetical protein